MKQVLLFSILLLFAGCEKKESTLKPVEVLKTSDSVQVTKEVPPEPSTSKKYSNQRFREVQVEKLADNQFRVRGQGQIFEASFNWVVEDGHYELAEGFETTDAGAPEWGNFDFTLDIPKKDANSTLTLILYESSAKDGSRQHELPVPLE
ncbi:MAG TPA: Gmad2 immunoglobulin-like domain-containing protein [Flavobacterium sp.]|nr:Gmad2 immunoglobulin-like domain-containing protein [Flavobacterium sp.]